MRWGFAHEKTLTGLFSDKYEESCFRSISYNSWAKAHNEHVSAQGGEMTRANGLHDV